MALKGLVRVGNADLPEAYVVCVEATHHRSPWTGEEKMRAWLHIFPTEDLRRRSDGLHSFQGHVTHVELPMPAGGTVSIAAAYGALGALALPPEVHDGVRADPGPEPGIVEPRRIDHDDPAEKARLEAEQERRFQEGRKAHDEWAARVLAKERAAVEMGTNPIAVGTGIRAWVVGRA